MRSRRTSPRCRQCRAVTWAAWAWACNLPRPTVGYGAGRGEYARPVVCQVCGYSRLLHTCRKEIGGECSSCPGTVRNGRRASHSRRDWMFRAEPGAVQERYPKVLVINDGIDLKGRCPACVRRMGINCAPAMKALFIIPTQMSGFFRKRKFWDFRSRLVPARQRRLFPIRLCALKRSAYRTNTAVVPASPQLLIPSPQVRQHACGRSVIASKAFSGSAPCCAHDRSH